MPTFDHNPDLDLVYSSLVKELTAKHLQSEMEYTKVFPCIKTSALIDYVLHHAQKESTFDVFTLRKPDSETIL